MATGSQGSAGQSGSQQHTAMNVSYRHPKSDAEVNNTGHIDGSDYSEVNDISYLNHAEMPANLPDRFCCQVHNTVNRDPTMFVSEYTLYKYTVFIAKNIF